MLFVCINALFLLDLDLFRVSSAWEAAQEGLTEKLKRTFAFTSSAMFAEQIIHQLQPETYHLSWTQTHIFLRLHVLDDKELQEPKNPSEFSDFCIFQGKICKNKAIRL